MVKRIGIFFFAFAGIFIIDQNIKVLFLEGMQWQSKCLSLVFTLNKGVAFSMFAFLGGYLKYIQGAFIVGVLVYLFANKTVFERYSLPFGILLGAGVSNLYDRFIHGGVIDYIYWHCGFDFAIFNFADVMIDLSILIIIYNSLRKNKSTFR